MKNMLICALFTMLAGSSLLWAAERTVSLEISGMACPACPITVKKALQRVPGVEKVVVSYERKETMVTFDDAKTSVDTLVKTTTDLGYPSAPKAY